MKPAAGLAGSRGVADTAGGLAPIGDEDKIIGVVGILVVAAACGVELILIRNELDEPRMRAHGQHVGVDREGEGIRCQSINVVGAGDPPEYPVYKDTSRESSMASGPDRWQRCQPRCPQKPATPGS